MNQRFVAGVITVTITLIIVSITEIQQERQLAYARLPGFSAGIAEQRAVATPIAISGENIYIAWPTNQTGNDEVNFRASADDGATFADKINLSNSTGTESQDVEIAADGDNVIVTWWERNSTSNEPVMKVSTDNGATFGPLLKLATNGTIDSTGSEG